MINMVKEKLLLNGTSVKGNPSYKSYIDRIGKERVLDQVKNHLVIEQPVSLEDKPILITQEQQFAYKKRHEEEIYNNARNIMQVFLNTGKDYSYQLRPFVEDVHNEEMILGSLIPGAVVSYNLSCKKWWQERHNDTRSSVFRPW